MAPQIINWIFGITYIVIGVLNMLLVHIVPGIFYFLLSFLYFPPADTMLKTRFGLSIPLVLKVVVGLVILWGTLAVGDLAEKLGF